MFQKKFLPSTPNGTYDAMFDDMLDRPQEWQRALMLAVLAKNPDFSVSYALLRAKAFLHIECIPGRLPVRIWPHWPPGCAAPQAKLEATLDDHLVVDLLFGFDPEEQAWYVLANTGSTTDRDRAERLLATRKRVTTFEELRMAAGQHK